MTTKHATTYALLLQMASNKLERGDYDNASKLLNHCCRLATPSVSSDCGDTNLLNYCKATILLAATRLRLHQKAAALQDFNQALHKLHRLYTETQDSETQTIIRRYQAVLIRANQTACTLSRLAKSVEVFSHEKTTQISRPH